MANHYFIGIGGTGGNVVCALRKAMHLREAEIEKCGDKFRCGFLYVDSNDKELFEAGGQWQILGTSVDLPPADKLLIRDGNIGAVLNNVGQQPGISPWIGDLAQVAGVLGAQAGVPGAQQRRRFGRFLFATHVQSFKQKVNAKVEQMGQGATGECHFHLIGTFAGGTGSGCLLDAALAIRSIYPNPDDHRITLYVLITDNAAGAADVGYFYPNQYAALKDVNAVLLGKAKLHDVGSAVGGTFDRREPVHRCFLLSNQNADKVNLSKADQERILAEWLLQLAVAGAQGNIKTDAQHAITGEDIEPGWPGEPSEDPARSYRFASLGILRWAAPQQLIRERLANAVGHRLVNQLLYNNWNEALGGYLEEQRTSNVENFYNAHPLSAWDLSLTQITTEGSADKFETQWSNRLRTTVNRVSNDTGNVLELLEQDAANYYERNFRDTGVEAYFRQLTTAKDARTRELAGAMEVKLRAALRSGELGIADILTVLERIGRDVELEITRCREEHQEDLKRVTDLDQSLSRRRPEWSKVGILSKLFGKKGRLIAQHSSGIVSLYSRRTRAQALSYAEEILVSMKTEVARLQGAVAHIKRDLDSVRDSFKAEYSSVAGQLHDPGTLGKVELKEDEFRALEKAIQESRSHIGPASDAVRLGLFEHRTFFEVARVGSAFISEIARESDLAVQRAHTDLVNDAKQGLSPMIGVNLIDVLFHRHGGMTAPLKAEIQHFVRSAVSALRLDNAATQPSALLGTNAPTMPKRHLLIQLPAAPPATDAAMHASLTKFREDLQEAFRGSVTQGTQISFSDSSDPTEITVVGIIYWMAARFAAPVRQLKEMYTTAISSLGDSRNAKYFCHLDENYELMPDLFPPETEQIRAMGEAFLDLGRRAGVIETRDTGEILLNTTDKSGVVIPQSLGPDEKKFLTGSDAKIEQQVAAIKAELRKQPSETFDGIAAKRTEELKALGEKIGTGHQEYRAAVQKWDERLKYIAVLKK